MKTKESIKEIELNLKELLFILSEAFENERKLAVSDFIKELENHASVIVNKDMPPFVIKGDIIIAKNWWASMKLKWGIK
jgi:purine nucleoside permease